MLLADKGPIRPVPTLTGPAERVSRAIQAWPEVIAATHWQLGDPTVVDGADFYVGEAELGHIHLDGEVHLPLTRALAALLVERGLAEPFPWGRDWVTAPIASESEADRAAWLFRLGYDRLRGASDNDLRGRIEERARLPA